jgi:hypothetical protein
MTKLSAFIFPADAIWILVTDFVQRDARTFTAFKLKLWITAYDFTCAIPLITSIGAIRFTVTI